MIERIPERSSLRVRIEVSVEGLARRFEYEPPKIRLYRERRLGADDLESVLADATALDGENRMGEGLDRGDIHVFADRRRKVQGSSIGRHTPTSVTKLWARLDQLTKAAVTEAPPPEVVLASREVTARRLGFLREKGTPIRDVASLLPTARAPYEEACRLSPFFVPAARKALQAESSAEASMKLPPFVALGERVFEVEVLVSEKEAASVPK
ncbi:MAG: hypothetical protein KDB53_18350 [Planctomycetes bacterium]|nr:hypothetical protein [Planctomycetota bacterium]